MDISMLNKGKFQKGQSGNPAGCPKGAKGKRGQLPDVLTDQALTQLAQLVQEGDVQAIRMVLDRTIPALRAITAPNSLDAELLQMKIREIQEFEERLQALEASRDQ